jgi:ribonuclease HI
VKDCLNLLNRACNQRPINISWIKTHVDLTDNEMADQEAKHGSALKAIRPGPWLLVINTLKKLFFYIVR